MDTDVGIVEIEMITHRDIYMANDFRYSSRQTAG